MKIFPIVLVALACCAGCVAPAPFIEDDLRFFDKDPLAARLDNIEISKPSVSPVKGWTLIGKWKATMPLLERSNGGSSSGSLRAYSLTPREKEETVVYEFQKSGSYTATVIANPQKGRLFPNSTDYLYQVGMMTEYRGVWSFKDGVLTLRPQTSETSSFMNGEQTYAGAPVECEKNGENDYITRMKVVWHSKNEFLLKELDTSKMYKNGPWPCRRTISYDSKGRSTERCVFSQGIRDGKETGLITETARGPMLFRREASK